MSRVISCQANPSWKYLAQSSLNDVHYVSVSRPNLKNIKRHRITSSACALAYNTLDCDGCDKSKIIVLPSKKGKSRCVLACDKGYRLVVSHAAAAIRKFNFNSVHGPPTQSRSWARSGAAAKRLARYNQSDTNRLRLLAGKKDQENWSKRLKMRHYGWIFTICMTQYGTPSFGRWYFFNFFCTFECMLSARWRRQSRCLPLLPSSHASPLLPSPPSLRLPGLVSYSMFVLLGTITLNSLAER